MSVCVFVPDCSSDFSDLFCNGWGWLSDEEFHDPVDHWYTYFAWGLFAWNQVAMSLLLCESIFINASFLAQQPNQCFDFHWYQSFPNVSQYRKLTAQVIAVLHSSFKANMTIIPHSQEGVRTPFNYLWHDETRINNEQIYSLIVVVTDPNYYVSLLTLPETSALLPRMGITTAIWHSSGLQGQCNYSSKSGISKQPSFLSAVIQATVMHLPILSNGMEEMFSWKSEASATDLVKFDYFSDKRSLAEVKFNKLMNTSEWPSLCLALTSGAGIQIQKYGKNHWGRGGERQRKGEPRWKISLVPQNLTVHSSYPCAQLALLGCFRHRLVTFNPDKYVALMLLWSPNLLEGDTFWD